MCKEQAAGHGLLIEFTDRQPPRAIPDDAALCLYRIVQEALRNIIKHSGARRVGVDLGGAAGVVDLVIVDDGAGFDPRLADGKGSLGLVSMRERLRLVGGEIAIASKPGAGTSIVVRVPLDGAGPAGQALPARPPGVG
jgi:signal transduction histidine kinase